MRACSMIPHLNKVEDEFDMSGLSTGLYAEYANDVAVSFTKDILYALREDGKLSICDEEISVMFDNDGIVEQYVDD